MYSVFPSFQSSTLVHDPINRKINLDSLSDFLISLFLFQKLKPLCETPNIFLMNLLLFFSRNYSSQGKDITCYSHMIEHDSFDLSLIRI